MLFSGNKFAFSCCECYVIILLLTSECAFMAVLIPDHHVDYMYLLHVLVDKR